MTARFLPAVLVLLATSAWPATGQAVVFDLDTGSPLLVVGQPLPLQQTAGHLTATFAGDFSVQSAGSTSFYLTLLQGKYIYPNGTGAVLQVTFSRPVSSLTMAFATADSHQNEIPTTISLTAWLGSTATAPVGTVSAHGTYGSATFPEGTLVFDPGGRPFDIVEVGIPSAPGAATGFLADALTVVPVPHVPRRHLSGPVR
jgi:hypothetical protein